MAFIRCDPWCFHWRGLRLSEQSGLCVANEMPLSFVTARQLGGLRGGACPGCPVYKVTGKTQVFPLDSLSFHCVIQHIIPDRTGAMESKGQVIGLRVNRHPLRLV